MLDFSKSETYTVGTHFMSAIINGDYSGLSDEETSELDKFLEKFYGVWTYEVIEEHIDICEVSGKLSTVGELEFTPISIPTTIDG